MRHLWIPDPQVKRDVPINHLRAVMNYAVAKQPEYILCAGDFADMPSLSLYDEGKKASEGARYWEDIEAANDALTYMMQPLEEYNRKKVGFKKKQYKPHLIMLMGNHEDRITRHVERYPVLEHTLSLDDLHYKEHGFEVIPYQYIINIDGIRYCHYFKNPHSLVGSVVGGTIDTKLKNLGWSFTMGHQQNLQYGVQHLSDGGSRQGLVAGAYYQHDEPYQGPQGNASHWRGCIMKNEVHDGSYDPCFLSLNYLLNRWV